MAEYLVLIYGDEAASAADPRTSDGTMLKEHVVFQERNGASLRGGNALQPASTATTIRRDANGAPVVTDGPFAKDVPADFGGVEVRPIRVFDRG